MSKDFGTNNVKLTQAYQPEGREPAPPQQDAPVLPHPVEPDFYYAAKPGNYMSIEVDSSGTREFLPRLKKLKIQPGINGVTSSGSTVLMRTKASDEGWIVIPHDAYPGGYRREYQTRAGRAVYDRWRKPVLMPGGEADWVLDIQGYAEFARWVEANILGGPPADSVIDSYLDRARTRIAELSEQAAGKPSMQGRLDDRMLALEAMEAKATGSAPPKGRKRTAARARAEAAKAKANA